MGRYIQRNNPCYRVLRHGRLAELSGNRHGNVPAWSLPMVILDTIPSFQTGRSPLGSGSHDWVVAYEAHGMATREKRSRGRPGKAHVRFSKVWGWMQRTLGGFCSDSYEWTMVFKDTWGRGRLMGKRFLGRDQAKGSRAGRMDTRGLPR